MLILALAGWQVRALGVFEPQASTHIRTIGAIEGARNGLIAEIFGAGLPGERGVLKPADSPVSGLDDLYRVEEIAMARYPSRPVLWHPESPNGRLIVLHQGHSWGYNDGNYGAVVQRLLTAGFTVCGMVMPGGSAQTSGSSAAHDEQELALELFIGPVVVAVNTLADRFDISIAGLSGGAWTATLAAAVDARIEETFNIAGNLPLYMPLTGPGQRDHEQFLPGLTASYQDLYLLGATPARRHIQILFTDDPCCFSAQDYRSRNPYGDYIAALARELGGEFKLVWEDKRVHEWDADVLLRAAQGS